MIRVGESLCLRRVDGRFREDDLLAPTDRSWPAGADQGQSANWRCRAFRDIAPAQNDEADTQESQPELFAD